MSIVQVDDSMRTLEVVPYGEITPLTDTLSKGRVRIFYKGLNRNRTFISDEFANQLIASLPYAPIKGIFNYGKVDFEDHGEDNTDGRMYGVVAAEPNFAWEEHLDKDGVKRMYACADVVLHTSLYPEAKLIIGKPQSMEIYKDNLEGEWRIWEDGLPYFHFYKGSLLGLQILGDTVEPCFEGSAFFSLYKDGKELFDYIKKNKKEEKNMNIDKSMFKLSDNAKADLIWDSLNPNFNEAGDWEVSYSICDVYDSYALCYDRINKKYVRVSYTKDDSNDTVSIGEITDTYIVDITATEKVALEALQAVGSYEEINSKLSENAETIENLTTTKENFEKQISEQIETIATLNNEKEELEKTISENTENYNKSIEEFNSKISSLEAEKVELNNEKNNIINDRDSLAEFKKQIETDRKIEILDEFADKLSETQYNDFKNTVETYSTIEDFKKEVCVTVYNSNPNIFSQNNNIGYIPKEEGIHVEETGALRILDRYKNGGNR